MQVIAAGLVSCRTEAQANTAQAAQGAKLPLPAGLEPATLGCPKNPVAVSTTNVAPCYRSHKTYALTN